MLADFAKLGIRFQYPDNWSLDSQAALNDGREVAAYSPEGGFWSVAIYERGTVPQKILDELATAMRAEYQEVDCESLVEPLLGHEQLNCELNFYCLDLTSTAIARVFTGLWGNYLVIYQAEDREFARLAEVFDAMTHSFLRESNLGIVPAIPPVKRGLQRKSSAQQLSSPVEGADDESE